MAKPKILVEFVGGVFPKRKKFPVENNKAIIKQRNPKGGRNGAEETIEFDNTCLVPYYAGVPPFRVVKHKILAKIGASKAVSFRNETGECPSCTKQDIANYSNATVIGAAGRLKPESRTLVYVLLIVLIIVGVFNLLIASGRVNI